jgi:hypothetical protein
MRDHGAELLTGLLASASVFFTAQKRKCERAPSVLSVSVSNPFAHGSRNCWPLVALLQGAVSPPAASVSVLRVQGAAQAHVLTFPPFQALSRVACVQRCVMIRLILVSPASVASCRLSPCVRSCVMDAPAPLLPIVLLLPFADVYRGLSWPRLPLVAGVASWPLSGAYNPSWPCISARGSCSTSLKRPSV